jgi:hypothetical protein
MARRTKKGHSANVMNECVWMYVQYMMKKTNNEWLRATKSLKKGPEERILDMQEMYRRNIL